MDQPVLHMGAGAHHLAEFVAARGVDFRCQVTRGNGLGHRDGIVQGLADLLDQEQRATNQNQYQHRNHQPGK